MERAKVRPRYEIFSLVRVYRVENVLVGNQLSIFGDEVVGLSRLCI